MSKLSKNCADQSVRVVQAGFWCVYIALNQRFGVGADRLNRVSAASDVIQDEYLQLVKELGSDRGIQQMQENISLICDPVVNTPKVKAAKKYKDLQIQMARDRGANIAWAVMARTVHEVLGFGCHRLCRLKDEFLWNLRQYIEWCANDGEDVAWEMLCRHVSKAFGRELEVTDDPNMILNKKEDFT